MRRKLKSLKELLVLKATYNQELHEAIVNGDEKFIKDYVKNYDDDDVDRYNMKEEINILSLQIMLHESDKNYEHAIATGIRIMGM